MALQVKDYGYRQLHNVLAFISQYDRPQKYLEIGVREGGSLNAVLDHHHPKKLYLCDTWGRAYGGTGRGNPAHIEKLLRESEYYGEVHFLNGDSKIMIPRLKETFDLILVDGDHSYKGAYKDLQNVWPLLEKPGYLVFDDITHKSHKYLLKCVHRFIREVDAKVMYEDLTPNGVIVLSK